MQVTIKLPDMNTEPSKAGALLNRWHQPHLWLTAAISTLIFSAIVMIGFVRGYLDFAQIYFEWHFTGESPLSATVIVITTLAVIPIIVSVSGATVILLSSRKKLGVCVSLATIGTYFLMDAVLIGFLWDGYHFFQSYSHAEWLVRSFNAYGDYPQSIFAFYLLYVLALMGMVIFILQGWRKLFKEQTA